jgi:hypothetical protein
MAHTELDLDQRGEACGGPQIGAVTLRQRTLKQQANKLLPLSGGHVSALPSSIARAAH